MEYSLHVTFIGDLEMRVDVKERSHSSPRWFHMVCLSCLVVTSSSDNKIQSGSQMAAANVSMAGRISALAR